MEAGDGPTLFNMSEEEVPLDGARGCSPSPLCRLADPSVTDSAEPEDDGGDGVEGAAANAEDRDEEGGKWLACLMGC